jgi:uncharacterized protein (DUF433 family)
MNQNSSMAKEYIEERDGGYYVAGTRVSLDSIVQCFNEGLSPEAILEEFGTLTLAQVFGAMQVSPLVLRAGRVPGLQPTPSSASPGVVECGRAGPGGLGRIRGSAPQRSGDFQSQPMLPA